MRNFVIIFLATGILLLGYVLYIVVSTGYFRKIEDSAYTKSHTIPLPGVEDIEISYEDDFLIFSSDDRAARREGNPRQGHLYYYRRSNNRDSLVQLTKELDFPFFPHGIYMLKVDSATHRIWVINHPKDRHTVEIFDLKKDKLHHIVTHSDPLMISPNDIYATSADTYFFTNDHGATSGIGILAENYLGLPISDVVYFDGTGYRQVADGIAYANGIAGITQRNILFVASPRAFAIKVYSVGDKGTLHHIEDIHCGTGVDNIEITPEETLWIGAHPNLLRFTSYAAGKSKTSPTEILRLQYRSTGDYELMPVFTNSGELVSASTIAIPYKNLVYIGNVMDDHLPAIALP